MHDAGMSPYSAPRTPRLLVSVRSVAEAEAALVGGADVIDVKEPARGALGRADDAVISAVLAHVGEQRPVSAALGELADCASPPPAGLTYFKFGLAGCAAQPWRAMLAEWQTEYGPGRRPQLVIAAYADAPAADAPLLEDVADFACKLPGQVLLVDTCTKRGTLLEWMSSEAVARLCAACRAAGVRVALAGSLGATEIAHLCAAQPHWFAVRRAACRDGLRRGTVCADRVRDLVEAIQASSVSLASSGLDRP